MTWSNKYKKSIDCNNPKGFSQKAHCQARKLRQAGKETKSEPVNEARVDKHEVSGKVVIDGHVFNDAGKSGRVTYGRYSTPDPDYKKDPKEVGMHRNYRRPSSLSFSTLADAKKWIKTQPKKSQEEIDRIHKKHADFEKYMNEEIIQETIRHEGSKWNIYSKDGSKRLGSYDTETAAKKRLRQIEYFKHMHEEVPVNNVGGGQVAGLGVGDQGEPGVKKKKRQIIPFRMFKRK